MREIVERFVGVPYDEASMDCADLVVLVQRELFGREVRMPGRRPRGTEGQAALGSLSMPLCRPTERPSDGDLVLMTEAPHKRPGHAGVFFFLAHEGWVLHSNERNGCSVLHRVRDLPDFGLRIEGYYTWA
ncbi:peptidoglycan endopeptidase [uncultured Stenotrophomonas sp.]|uniref:peptidoglycan endopeptidase n=1 Tax=uncultured Stenotrophomonas sp. TaxID=165438 RepID=UPI0025CC7462|nr:peptidoglycan endopeptidase [uncultured Stenotrophomonas sp.]